MCRSWLFLLFILLHGYAHELCAQNDCRLQLDQLEPIIERHNPYFSDHKWDADTRLEMARLGPHRLLLITQDGCKRHHTQFNLIIDPVATENRQQFWINEVKVLLHKAYNDQAVYREFRRPFGEAFERQLAIHGLNEQFNFPIGTRNFLCKINYDPTRGSQISIEMVTFIFREKVEVQRRGIPRDQDDGWLERSSSSLIMRYA